MATADQARQLRTQKGAINHETYRSIFDKITQRIETWAKRGQTSIEYRVPSLVPGRPIYDIRHAVRYCHDKLKHRGFRVDIQPPDVLFIDWKPAPATLASPQKPAAVAVTAPSPRKVPRNYHPNHPPPPTTTVATTKMKTKKDITAQLDILARKLNWK